MEMKTYQIEIQEILTRVVEVEATSSKDATDLVYEGYKNEKYVLDYNDLKTLNFVDINVEPTESNMKRLSKDIVDYLYKIEERHYEESDNPESHIFLKLKELKDLIS